MFHKVQDEETLMAYKTLHVHINQFKGKIEYLDNRFKFEVPNLPLIFNIRNINGKGDFIISSLLSCYKHMKRNPNISRVIRKITYQLQLWPM
jgi:hypothetical protein